MGKADSKPCHGCKQKPRKVRRTGSVSTYCAECDYLFNQKHNAHRDPSPATELGFTPAVKRKPDAPTPKPRQWRINPPRPAICTEPVVRMIPKKEKRNG